MTSQFHAQLRRSSQEKKIAPFLVIQHKLHRAIAETAVAIEDEHWTICRDLIQVRDNICHEIYLKWRKRVRVEHTRDTSGAPRTGFEDREDHRTPCASALER